jgi:glycosyltransferase EpsD
MKWFKEQGWTVDNISPGIEIADYVDNQYDVPITRNPISFKNILAYRIIKEIILRNKYTIVHCHTPIGGVLGRLCSIKTRKSNEERVSVIYTCHGFHFYKGSSLITWVIYYSIEKILSHYTDCIVTINQEDYLTAKENFYARNVFKINGVGVNLQKFKSITNEEKTLLRNKYGFNNNDFILVYVAQFIPRKNHIFFINQISSLLKIIYKLKILFVGGEYLIKKYKILVESKNLQDHILFMGYRKDLENIYPLSDIVISVSKQEGFGLNLIEGMACGLPVVCSKIRGHVDIVKPSINGFLFNLDDADEMKNRIFQLYTDVSLYKTISKQNIIDVQKFSVINSVNGMAQIYKLYMPALYKNHLKSPYKRNHQ